MSGLSKEPIGLSARTRSEERSGNLDAQHPAAERGWLIVLLSLEGIDVAFRRAGAPIQILDSFSIDVADGEFVVLAGRSGSGKSTAIAVGYGRRTPDAGEVRWGDTVLAGHGEKELQRIRRESIGYAAQDSLVFDDLTVAANIGVGGGSKERCAELLEGVGLADFEKMRAGRISGGERQRVAVARALAKDPALVLMDEPTSSLDKIAAGLVVDQLRAAADRGAAVLVATHDPLVKDAADRVIEL